MSSPCCELAVLWHPLLEQFDVVPADARVENAGLATEQLNVLDGVNPDDPVVLPVLDVEEADPEREARTAAARSFELSSFFSVQWLKTSNKNVKYEI